MPGQLGNVQRTIQNLTIVKIMPEENVMLVKGSVPGHKGSVVIIKPTQKKYTPKEIFTEDVIKASPITDKGSADDDKAQIADEAEKKETNKQDDKK